MTPKQLGALFLLAALWGGSFAFMRVGAPAVGPIVLIAVRVLLAGLALLAYGAAVGNLEPPGRHWRHYAVIGTINSAVPFLLLSAASLHLPASVTATLIATTPLFSAVISALWQGEALPVRKVSGLFLGAAGVATLVGIGPLVLTPAVVLAVLASLLAALSYGLSAVYTRARVKGGSPMALATYSQLFAALLTLPLAPFALPAAMPSMRVIGSIVALALLCTAFAYVLYFYLIVEAGPTRATIVTYLSPASGMLWGALLLKEPITVGNLVGLAVILSSVALVAGGTQETRREQYAHR